MWESRKLFSAAVLILACFESSNSAFAQALPFVCNTSFSPLVVRVEGLRELVGDIVISCTGGNSIGSPTSQILSLDTAPNPDVANIAAGVVAAPGTGIAGTIGAGGSYTAIGNPTVPAINISITVAGTRITNRIFSGNLTDALLFIDEPANPVSGANLGNQNPCLNTGTTVGTAGVCTNQSYFFTNGVATGSGYPTTSSNSPVGNPINIYQAQYGVGGGFAPNEQTITFVGVPVVQPGTYPGAGSRVYRIKNIRVQVANSFQVNGQIQAFISIQNPPANLVLNNAQGVVGFVQRGLFFDVIAGGPYAQCLGWNSGSYPSSTQNAATGALRFTEAYGVAFKRRGFASSTLDVQEPVYNQFYRNGFGQSDPRVNYSNESGFYNIQLGGSGNKNNLNDAGIASQGTRLRARFSGVPSQVRVYVSAQPATTAIGCTASGSNSIYAGATSFCIGQGTTAGNAAFAVGGVNADGAAIGFTPNTDYGFSVGSNALVQGSTADGWGGGGAAYGALPLSLSLIQVAIAADGTGNFFWEVLRADDNVIDQFSFLVAVSFSGTTSIVTDANSSVVSSVSGNFAPIAAAGDNGYPSIPSFALVQPEDLKPIFSFANCATNLLYPFVSSLTGFNTGIAVANVSKDPFGTENETGICRVYFYGTTVGGGIDPTPQSFRLSVPSGRIATFNLLFGGPEYGIQPVVGFQGYIIISCNFRWAHGFAFVSDPSNLQTAQGYLALILDPSGLGRNTGAQQAESRDN